MSEKRVGWCRLTEELVLEGDELLIPYLRDDMDLYIKSSNGGWLIWTAETQSYSTAVLDNIPEVVKMAMVMLE